jgi:hypothetical protein
MIPQSLSPKEKMNCYEWTRKDCGLPLEAA